MSLREKRSAFGRALGLFDRSESGSSTTGTTSSGSIPGSTNSTSSGSFANLSGSIPGSTSTSNLISSGPGPGPRPLTPSSNGVGSGYGFPIVPSPPTMSPQSVPSNMIDSEIPEHPEPNSEAPHVAFVEPSPNRPPSTTSTQKSRKKDKKARPAGNLFSAGPRTPQSPRGPGPASPVQQIHTPTHRAPIQGGPGASPHGHLAPPVPTYESIQVIAHRPEDLAAVRSSLAQLQLTWSLYRELGRPSNLAEALERQIASMAASVDRLADMPPFTINVPTLSRSE